KGAHKDAPFRHNGMAAAMFIVARTDTFKKTAAVSAAERIARDERRKRTSSRRSKARHTHAQIAAPLKVERVHERSEAAYTILATQVIGGRNFEFEAPGSRLTSEQIAGVAAYNDALERKIVRLKKGSFYEDEA
ncbi:MAG: hypothetical protein AAGE89_18300, partial [Pseudomonadota bacterium]